MTKATQYGSLTVLATEVEYRQFFNEEYCSKVILTHDGIEVKFRPEHFDHAFFKNASRHARDKSIFSRERAERITWIKQALLDKSLTLYAGWDSRKKRYDHTRRVCLVTPNGYVVVLRITSKSTAVFNTAYLIDDPDVESKIKGSPIWK